LNSLRQRPEIGDTLKLVVRKFNIKVLFQARKQAQRLQAVDTKLLEKVVVRREVFAWDLELSGRQIQDFVDRLLLGFHDVIYGKYGSASVLSTNFFSPLRTAGCVNSSQKISISRRSSSYGIGLMNSLAATAARRSNFTS